MFVFFIFSILRFLDSLIFGRKQVIQADDYQKRVFFISTPLNGLETIDMFVRMCFICMTINPMKYDSFVRSIP